MIIALNNKSNLTKQEFIKYQEQLSNINTSNKMILCPTFLNISQFNLSNFSLGSQDVSATNDGAYTGEISAKDLKSYNVEYAIIGHSERRAYQKESFEEINAKIKKLLENNITPILCVGETKKEKEQNKTKEIIKKELMTAIVNLKNVDKNKIIIAYEPIWSIGTGIIPNNNEITEVFEYIKTFLPNNKILYGGSANEENITTLKRCNIIDGFLLGGISLKPDKLKIFVSKLEK